MRLGRAIFGFFFAMISLLGLAGNMLATTEVAYADPPEQTVTTVEEGSGEESTESGSSSENGSSSSSSATGDGCQASLGAIGWLVCPTTGKIAEAVDWLYDKIEDILAIDPVVAEDGSPIYEIWKYCRGVTNVVFIIFLLVVIYSQLTGLGISNYGIKKALPKLIVAAILVNLSFLICMLAVDASNIIGNSLRGLFESVENTAVAGMSGGSSVDMKMASAQMYSAIAGGTAITVAGAAIAFETGAIWMLIPVVLGAIVAVATGLITIALRQAVVALLIMIAPLAMVAYMLPNTESLFQKWKKLLTQMLVFYPMFSLLFGASELAGFAIIASAKDGFGLLLGMAVQIFPLFFSWKLMQMSGTFLGNINSKIRGIAARPVAGSRAWANSQKMASKQKHLASNRTVIPTRRLMQRVNDRMVAKEADTANYAEIAKSRGLAYRAWRNYDKKGVPTKYAEEAYENQARSMEYQRAIARDQNNMEKGLGYLAAEGTAKRARLDRLDDRNVKASDYLKVEQARGEKIAYENAVGFHKRMENAMNVHMDRENGYKPETRDGQRVMVPKSDYRFHKMEGGDTVQSAATRYEKMSEIMEGNAADVQFAVAGAAHAYDTQRKIIETKYQKYFELLPPTKDVENRLSELTKVPNAAEYIDTILPGMRILNQRGDTDLVRKQMENVLNSTEGVELGTHASQALASFLMFEVKDNDPYLRRFGKYINLETAQVYNKNKRQNARLSLEEYVTGEYEDWEPGHPEIKIVKNSKRGIVPLMEGTSLDNLERTAYGNLDDILKQAYTSDSGLDIKRYLAKREEIEVATTPAFITASTKYLAGSEQLKNAVSFLTGIDDSGKTRWGEGGDLAGDATMAEKYFRKRSMQYIKDQTPAQILGMRSDYRDAMMEHLVNEYLEQHPDERAEYNEEMARIQNDYGDEDATTAEEKREKDRKEVKMDLAGRQIRQILGDSGKLEQIYRTRRSGAANNAKDWLREWVNLDNENALKKEVDFYKEKREQEWREEMLVTFTLALRVANLADWDSLTDAEAMAIRWREPIEYWYEVLSSGTLDLQMEVFRDRKGVEERCKMILSSTPTKSQVA